MTADLTADRNRVEVPRARLLLPADVHRAVISHCLRENPLECCGVLGGVGTLAKTAHPLGNLARSETRYQGDPRDLVEAWRWLREHDMDIVAIYHSHPRWEAVPSSVDRLENHWGEMIHVIVSLLTDPPTLRAWRLYHDSQEELTWELVQASTGSSEPLRPAPSAD